MTAEALFSLVNLIAMSGWIMLGAGIALKRPWLRDVIAGLYVPVLLSAAYAVLIAFFFGQAEGGFDTLSNVQLLFASPWILLAGWIHYLAFDLYVGARIAQGMVKAGLPKWPLAILLPLTLLFGPIGFLGYQILIAVNIRMEKAAS